MLSLSHIGKSFSGTRVLADVDFDLAPGEVHVLAGENGAGKSTLIKILAGAYQDYEGTIQLRGAPIRFRSPSDAARHGIAVIHQELSLVPSMSVLDNLFLGRATPGRERAGKAAEIFRRLSLDVDANQCVEDYPLAVQQMIEIGKALAIDARILIMDEPTSALNEVETDRLFAVVTDLKAQGCGIVYITHRMDEIYRLADRITVLRDGRNAGTAKASELAREQLIRWMVGREISGQFPTRRAAAGAERLAVRNFRVPGSMGKAWAVEDVSFTVRAGEILGVAGLQGSGNTELLHGLFGVYGAAATGEIRVDGQAASVASPSRAMSAGLALLTGDRKRAGIVPGLSVVSNVTLAALARFAPSGWIDTGAELAATAKHVESLGIRIASPQQEIQTLSGGNQQKVLIGRWLETAPRVLLLDEPTRGVDVGAKHEIYELMNQWTAAGISIVLITSEMQELLAMSDRIIVMHRGRMTAELAHGEFSQERILKAAMGMD